MLFRIHGIAEDSGKKIQLVIESDTLGHAMEEAANRGIKVEHADLCPPPIPTQPRKTNGGTKWLVAGGVMLVMLVFLGSLAAIIVYNQNIRNDIPTPGEAYYYDVVTKQYFTGKASRSLKSLTIPTGSRPLPSIWGERSTVPVNSTPRRNTHPGP